MNIRWIVAALFAVVLPSSALCQTYPDRPITMIVGWAPGGSVDLTGRLAAEGITKKLGQQVIVENRPGASGMVADKMVKAAAPDGYTLQSAGSTHATNPSMYPDAGFDPVTDFTPISMVASAPYVLVVDPQLPVNSVGELVDWLKQQEKPVYFGSAGNGSRQHLAGIMLQNLAGTKMVHVPYKGSAPAINDMLGGNFPLMFENLAIVLPHVQAGKMRALAVTTAERSALFPDLPTMAELGYDDFIVSGYFGIYGPANLPPEVTQKLNEAIVEYVRSPEIQERLANLGADAVGSTPEEFASFIQQDVDTWGKLIRENGIKPD